MAKKIEGESQEAYETMIAIWMEALSGKTPEAVKRGLTTLIASGNTFEPSVPEFVAMCKAPHASHQNYLGLTYSEKPDPNGPARMDHYPRKIRQQLKKIGMEPRADETHQEYCMRCKAYTMEKYSKYLPESLR